MMRKVYSVFIFIAIVGCMNPKNNDYYRKIMMSYFQCDFSADFIVLEHKRNSGIADYEEIFILSYPQEDLTTILNCIGTNYLDTVPDGFSIMIEIDTDERLWFVFDTINSTIEYHFCET